MNKQLFTFCFKGDRTYVHGTDICAALSDYAVNTFGADGIRNVDVLFHRAALKNLVLEVFINSDIKEKELAVATVAFMKNNDRYIMLLKETHIAVSCRNDYKEELVTSACTINLESGSIVLSSLLDFTIFEILSPMTKALHQHLFPEVQGKWFFTRLQTDRLLRTKENYRTIEIKQMQNFKHKLTRNEISINDHKIGSIYFSLV